MSNYYPWISVVHEPEHWFRTGKDWKLEISFDEGDEWIRTFDSNERFYEEKDAIRARNELYQRFKAICNKQTNQLMNSNCEGYR